MATINFNASEVEPSQEFQPLPEGKYEAVISDSDVKSTRNGSGRYVQLEFEVVSGEHKGRKVWGRYNIENPSADAVRIGRAIPVIASLLGPPHSRLSDYPLRCARVCNTAQGDGYGDLQVAVLQKPCGDGIHHASFLCSVAYASVTDFAPPSAAPVSGCRGIW